MRIDVPENTGAMLANFAARRYDLIAASVADVVPVLQRVPDLRILFCTDESAGADAVVARPDITGVAELRGRRIGVKFGGFAELFVRRMIASAGLSVDDVDLVDVDAAAIPAALASGRIDAGETWEPYLTELRDAGYREIHSSAAVPGLIVECVFAHGDVVRQRAEAMQAFVDGWFLAQDRLLADTARGLAVVARDLGRTDVVLSLAGVRFLGRDENRRRFSGDTIPLRTTLQRYERFFGERGQLRTPIQAQRLLEPRFLR